MKNTPNPVEENKKRAAFKRFSQMSAAGLAVLSLSAFSDAATKTLPANATTCSVEEQNRLLPNPETDQWLTTVSEMDQDVAHNLYSNYTNNYSNYSNGPYSNNYSNAC